MKRTAAALLAGLVFAAHVVGAADLFSPGFRLQDPTDPTKTATFDLSGLGTGTSPVFALPAGGGTLALTSMIPSAGPVPPLCLDAGGNHLNFNTSTNTFSCGTTTSGAGPTPGANSTVIVSNGTVFQNKAIPSCLDSTGQHLNFDTTTNTFSCGTTNSYTPPAAPFASFIGMTAARNYTLRDASTSIVTRSASLTSTRVPVVDANGELVDSANLIFDTAGKMTIGGNGFLCFNVTGAGGCFFGGSANSVRVMNLAGTAWLPFSATSFRAAQAGQLTFSNSTNPETTPDTGLARAAALVVKATNGSTGAAWIQNTAAVTGTAGDWTSTTTTLANINGLTRDLIGGRSYTFRLSLYTSDGDSTEGLKLDFGGGGAAATNFRAHCTVYDSTPTLQASAQVTTLSGALTVASVSGAAQVECSGEIEPSTSGTLIPRVAQNVHNAGTLTIARGSHLLLEDVPLQTAYNFQILAIGDSKTLGNICCTAANGYVNTLVSSLLGTGHWGSVGMTGMLASGGVTTASTRAQIPAFLATQTLQPDWALINLGSNDVPLIHTGSITSTTWLSDMGIILDAVHARWPTTKVRLMRPIHTTYLTECDTLATWIATAVSTRSSWAGVGPDERTLIPTHLSDVTHPDATGYALTAAAWQTTMGY